MSLKRTYFVAVDVQSDTTDQCEGCFDHVDRQLADVLRRVALEDIRHKIAGVSILGANAVHATRDAANDNAMPSDEKLVLVREASVNRLLATRRQLETDGSAPDDELLNNLAEAAGSLSREASLSQHVFARQATPSEHPFQIGITTSAYNPKYKDNGRPEYPDDPPVKWTIEESEGLRILMGVLPGDMGTAFNDRAEIPCVIIERNTAGCWTIFVCPDRGDQACSIYIGDRRHTTVLVNDYRDDVRTLNESEHRPIGQGGL